MARGETRPLGDVRAGLKRSDVHTLAPKPIAMGVDIPPMQDSASSSATPASITSECQQMRIVQSSSDRKDLLAA